MQYWIQDWTLGSRGAAGDTINWLSLSLEWIAAAVLDTVLDPGEERGCLYDQAYKLDNLL